MALRRSQSKAEDSLCPTVREKWNTPAESKPDWTTFESAFADIEKLLEDGKINHAQRTDLIAFYNGKRAQLD